MAAAPQSAVVKSNRAPAVTVALAVAAGICMSRAWPGGFSAWWLAATACGVAWVLLQSLRWPRISVVALLAGWMLLAAAWQDLAWSWVGPQDVSHLATDAGVSVRVVAKVIEPAWIIATADDDSAPFWLPPERTLTTFECRELVADSSRTPITGRVRLSLRGHYPELNCGDVVSVIGKLRLPAEPLNPGDFDYRTWLKTQGVRAILHAASPECIQPVQRESSWADVWGRTRHGAPAASPHAVPVDAQSGIVRRGGDAVARRPPPARCRSAPGVRR